MALATAVLTFVGLLVICLGFASLGNVLLRFLQLEMDRDADHLLCAIAVGLVTSEVLLFLVQVIQHVRSGCLGIVALLCAFLIVEWKALWKRMRRALAGVAADSCLDSVLLAFDVGRALVECVFPLGPADCYDACE